MNVNVVVPTIGESITEVEIAAWLVENGQYVEKGQDVVEIESEKATLTVSAEASGKINIAVQAGETVKIGTVIAVVEASEAPADAPTRSDVQDMPKAKPQGNLPEHTQVPLQNDLQTVRATPLARNIMATENIDPDNLPTPQNGQKISSKEVLGYLKHKSLRNERRVKMSSLRRKLSARLVHVKNTTAMLTTFNEVDMSNINTIRKQHKEAFLAAHGVKLGLMSFFIKAVSIALKEYPEVNASIDDDHIVYHDFSDISVAVSTDKGLMVPVLRNTELMSLAGIEKTVLSLSEKARTNRISIEEMTGGTFTVTNGGVFGSMLSTPIINPPQSAILGMHNITDRAVVVDGAITIRPIMYVALSYDHRIIDGKQSVGFLVRVKELLENPLKMVNEEQISIEQLLEL